MHCIYIITWVDTEWAYCVYNGSLCSQFLDDNDDAESQKFLSNGMMKKKKYEEYHEEYVRSHNTHIVYVYKSELMIYSDIYTFWKQLNPKKKQLHSFAFWKQTLDNWR